MARVGGVPALDDPVCAPTIAVLPVAAHHHEEHGAPVRLECVDQLHVKISALLSAGSTFFSVCPLDTIIRMGSVGWKARVQVPSK